MRAAILLAAGGSRRFGRGDKLLARLRDRPLIDHATEGALASGAQRILVVVPSRGGRLGRQVARQRDPRLRTIVARRHAKGLGASLSAGLAALRPVDRELVIFLGDMPLARLPAVRLGPALAATRPYRGAEPGHPLLVRTTLARRIGASGDKGLALGRAQVNAVRGTFGNFLDIDTPAALRRARRAGSFRRR